MLNFREKPAGIEDLTVVNFRTKLMSAAICAWKEATPVAMAESCARQIWFGEKSDFVNFPRPQTPKGAIPTGAQPQFELYEGREAYEFLLKLVTGLDSVREGETNIAGQFYPGWTNYQQQYPHKAQRLETVIQYLRADSGLIRSEIVSGIKPKRHELAARTLSRQEAGDHALVIGSLNDNNVLSNFTDGIVKVLANNRPGRVSQITVTHPDHAVTGELLHQVAMLNKNGFLKAHITAVDFTELQDAFESCDCAFIDLPMRALPDADVTIVDAWNRHAHPTNTLTHLRGDPANRALSSAEWASAGLKNYISPEDIRTEMTRIGENNLRLRNKALEVITFCADLRLAKLLPSRNALQKFYKIQPDTPPPPSAG